MIKADFHVHSNFSSDSKVTLDSQIETAIKLNFDYICITDHNDVAFKNKNDDKKYILDIGNYIKSVNASKEKYKDKITVLLGCEVGLIKKFKTEIVNSLKGYEFDFLIGSSHLVNGIDPSKKSYFEENGEKLGYLRYFETILDNVNVFDEYSVYGHLDYILRYGPNKNTNFEFSYYKEIFTEILKVIIAKGKGIEINTSGFNRGLNQFHPSIPIVKLYKNLGGEIITFGSDSHNNEMVGYMFDLAGQIVKSIGINYYAVFKNKKPEFFKI